MKEIKKEDRNDNLIQELVKVWENSVRATHKFLSNGVILEIKKYVPEAVLIILQLMKIILKQKAFMNIWDLKFMDEVYSMIKVTLIQFYI